jgi:hypothetical protein
MRYQLNLVRELREQEKRDALKRARLVMATVISLCLLGLSIAYAAWQIFSMEMVIKRERQKVARIENEYRQYTATEALVSNADITLLDELKNGSIFWTRKLSAMARHLPPGYATTRFAYDGAEFSIDGTGRIDSDQQHLVKLHGYMDRLERDSAFSDIFSKLYLNSAKRESNDSRGDFVFSISAEN